MSIYDKLSSEYQGAQPKIVSKPYQPIPSLTATLANANSAGEFHRRICEYIIEFEKSLQDDEDVALKLVSFGESIIIYVDDIGYYNPSLISFVGSIESGERVQLIQHVSQLSFLLMAVKTQKPPSERKRIGYKLSHELEQEQDKP